MGGREDSWGSSKKSEGPVELQKSVKQQEGCDDAKGYDFACFGRLLGATDMTGA
jgi:hypothetical protein